MMAQFLTEDSSWEALTPKLQQLNSRLTDLGLPTPKAVYLDNTMSSEASIRSALSSLNDVKEDHFHAMRRFTSQLPDDLPEKRECLLLSTMSDRLHVDASQLSEHGYSSSLLTLFVPASIFLVQSPSDLL